MTNLLTLLPYFSRASFKLSVLYGCRCCPNWVWNPPDFECSAAFNVHVALHHHHSNTSKYRQRNHLGRNYPRRPRRLGVWYVSRFMFLITYEPMVFLHILESKQLVMTWNDPHPTQTPSFIQTGFTGVTMNRRRLPACVLSTHALPPQPPRHFRFNGSPNESCNILGP